MTIEEDAHLLVKELEEDRSHGASELAWKVLQIVSSWASEYPAENSEHLLHCMSSFSYRLMQTQPSMVPFGIRLHALEKRSRLYRKRY